MGADDGHRSSIPPSIALGLEQHPPPPDLAAEMVELFEEALDRPAPTMDDLLRHDRAAVAEGRAKERADIVAWLRQLRGLPHTRALVLLLADRIEAGAAPRRD